MNTLLQTTVYLTVTAIALLIFKGLFKKRLSAKWQVYLWALLLVRLFVPALPQSEISVFNAIPMSTEQFDSQATPLHSEPSESAADAPSATAAFQDAAVASRNADHPAGNAGQDESAALHADIHWEAWLMRLWMVGSVALLLYFILIYCRHLLKIKKQTPVIASESLTLLDSCKQTLGIKRKVQLVTGDGSPMLAGFFAPKIVLPSGYSPKEQRDILLHELCHLKNGDIMILWLALVILCFNWFNPVIWYSFFVLRQDIEVYCDSRVLAYSDNKKEYAGLLLKTALRKNHFVAGTTSLQNGKKEVARRIKHMAYFKRPRLFQSAVITVIALGISAVCLTNASADYSLREEDLNRYCQQMVGSTMADIDYADGNQVVFHYADALFVYSQSTGKIDKSFDLSKLNCAPHQQGDYSLGVTVSADGKYALLTHLGAPEMITDFDSYRINLENGAVRTTSATALANPFTSFADTDTAVPNAKGWFSSTCITDGSKLWYLTCEGSPISSMKLCCYEQGTGETEAYIFGDNLYAKTEKYLSEEFYRVYTPYYEILDLRISDWRENFNEATFFYTMIHKNYDRGLNTVDYLQKAKQNGDKSYEQLRAEYLAPREGNYEFKVVLEGDSLKLYYNASPKGTDWQPITIDEFVGQ